MKSHAPPTPWIVMHAETVRGRMRVVVGAIPWIIVIACAIDYSWSVHITSHVARSVANINHFWRGFVDVNVPDIVSRRGRRDLVDVCGSFITHFVGTCRLQRYKPNTLIDAIVFTA